MTNEQAAPRAVVLRFQVPVGHGSPASPEAVRRLQQSSLTRQMLLSLAARDVAMSLHESDRFVGQAAIDVPFEQAAPEYVDKLTGRAAVALSLGDRLKRDVADEFAALAVLRGVDRGIRNGSIPASSPLARIDLTTARQLAKLALAGGLDFLAGRRP